MPSIDSHTHSDGGFVELGRAVIRTEAGAVAALESRLDDRFVEACERLIGCEGRIVVCGVGKSGHIGHKLAATLASTGSPAFFLHAAEASHGDLGMLRARDVMIALSYSGGSQELLALIPGIKRMGVQLIALCGHADSPLALASDVHLDVSVAREACPLNLAPTASTSAMLAMGDAIAIALLSTRGFSEDDFARSHPGGRLGRRLLLHVADVMSAGAQVPVVGPEATLVEAVGEISRKGLGMVLVADEHGALAGLYTDGDLRRTIEAGQDIRTLKVREVMTEDPRTIDADRLAVTAVGRLQEHRITALPVVGGGRIAGVVTMHALLAAGVV